MINYKQKVFLFLLKNNLVIKQEDYTFKNKKITDYLGIIEK